jgi:DedD protein
MNNQRGGIISKIFFIPVALALMAGFFILGYYVGKYRSPSGGPADSGPPLPDIASKNLPRPDEFTFYKTLTDKSDKTVSIDLQPKSSAVDRSVGKKPADGEPARIKVPQRLKDEEVTETGNSAASKQQAPPKKAAPSSAQNSRLRYTLQIASYQEKEMAESDIKSLKQRGYAAFIVSSELPGKGTWYRVRLGSFSSKASAEKLQKELLAKESISSIISIE